MTQPPCISRLFDDAEHFGVFACDCTSETNELARYVRWLQSELEDQGIGMTDKYERRGP